jgi:hypothetical protein
MGTVKEFPNKGARRGLERALQALGGLVTSRTLPHVVASGALLLLLGVSLLLWIEMKKRFPAIEPASYYGTIEGIFASVDGSPSRFYVERQPGGDEMIVVVVRAGWLPQVVSVVPRSGRSGGDEWMLPLTINGPDGTLSLIGTRAGPGEYVGRAVNSDTGREGSWQLAKIEDMAPVAQRDERELTLWLSLRYELLEVREQIAGLEKQVPAQKAEIDKLSAFISEGTRLRSSADEKFLKVKEQLREAQLELKQLQEEARKLEAQLDLAQRFTGMGRLVSLARESLEREGRWIDSMLRGDVVSTQSEIERAVARAEAVARVKREIQKLQRGTTAPQNGPAQEDS